MYDPLKIMIWLLQILLAVAAHMYISLRFIYSWPMDSASRIDNSTDNYEYADKFPGYVPFLLTTKQWMSESQRKMLPVYQIITLLTLSITIVAWVVVPMISLIRRMLTKTIGSEKSTTNIPYSTVPRILTYVPTTGEVFKELIHFFFHSPSIYRCAGDMFDSCTVLCADVAGVSNQHLPLASRDFDDIGGNLANLIPEECVSKVLSICRQFDRNRSIKYKGRPSITGVAKEDMLLLSKSVVWGDRSPVTSLFVWMMNRAARPNNTVVDASVDAPNKNTHREWTNRRGGMSQYPSQPQHLENKVVPQEMVELKCDEEEKEKEDAVRLGVSLV